ncbi:MAG: hypothetical protein WCO56_06600 [Verrucomicrobiota bacterium]
MRYFALIAIIAIFVGSGCKDARRGQSNANEAPVPDGNVILLRRSNEVAAVILHNQRTKPEQMDFSWYYRADGRGAFSPGDSAVSTGTVSNASKISFATFSTEWSINKNGMGWVYFSAGPTEFGKTADYVMCVTTETNVTVIDATAGKWKYRGRPGVNMRALIESQIKK